MPELHPALSQELIDFCQRFFRLPEDRDSVLLPVLSGSDRRYQIDWSGDARTFTARLLAALTTAELDLLLDGLVPFVGDHGRLAGLRTRIAAATTLMAGTNTALHADYYRATVKLLSDTRYQLDSRFVKLTLLLDQGADAQGLRFVQDGQRGRFDSLPALLAEVDDRALVLLGRPGSGKTTLLRRYQLEQAWEGLEGGLARVPFFVPLNAYRGAQPGHAPPAPLEWLAAEWQTRHRQLHPDLPEFMPLFSQGRLLLLLDGLNEMPHRDKADYRERVGSWRTFLEQTSQYGNLCLFSCRSLDYSASLSSTAVAVRQVQVEALAPQQIEQFLRLHLGETGTAVWQDHLRDDPDQQALFATPFFLQLLVGQIADTREMPAGRVGLLTGFVWRALQREVIEGRNRLFEPDGLLSEDDVQQINQNRQPGPLALPDDGPLIPQLSALAFGMQDGRETREAGQVRLPEAEARKLLDPALAQDLVAAGIQLNVLDKEVITHELYFFHQLMQEYFAARKLAAAPDPSRVEVGWRADAVEPSLADTLAALEVSDPLPGLPTTGWEETALLAAALVADPAEFVRALLPVNLPLAARCVASPEVNVAPELVVEIQQALLDRIGNGDADLRARIAAAEALGELGDPRFARRDGPHGPYLQPPLAQIPAGSYRIGSEDRTGCNLLWQVLRGRQRTEFEDEKPAHNVEIAGFEMGVFPITNAEYALFMQAGGYEDERWWETTAAKAWLAGEGSSAGLKSQLREIREYYRGMSDESIRALSGYTPEEIDAVLQLKHTGADALETFLEKQYPAGKIYRQPEYWNDSRFDNPAQPVVGLTWFEACAYCAWLSVQTGENYRLPTEAEWEAAARGSGGREYAYGATCDSGRCNTFETHIRTTTPVGVFPEGHTPEGISDLSGNVWEWTSTAYRPYPYEVDDGREQADDAVARRVVRGGSWYGPQVLARAAARSSYHPSNRGNDLGFRVVRRPPSQDH